MSAPNQKITVPTDGDLFKLVRARNHVWTLGNDSDDYSDLLSNKHLIVCSSSDEEPQSHQSSDKDDSFDMDPNIYPLCSTPNNSLQRVNIGDCCIDSSPSLPISPSINGTSSSLPNSPSTNENSSNDTPSSTNDQSQTKMDTT